MTAARHVAQHCLECSTGEAVTSALQHPHAACGGHPVGAARSPKAGDLLIRLATGDKLAEIGVAARSGDLDGLTGGIDGGGGLKTLGGVVGIGAGMDGDADVNTGAALLVGATAAAVAAVAAAPGDPPDMTAAAAAPAAQQRGRVPSHSELFHSRSLIRHKQRRDAHNKAL